MSGKSLIRWLKRQFHETRTNPNRRWLRMLLAITSLILGFLGLFLPFLQGILLIALGIGLLSFDYPVIGRTWRRLRARFRHSPPPEKTASPDDSPEPPRQNGNSPRRHT